MSSQEPSGHMMDNIPYASTPIEGILAGGQPSADVWPELARAGYRTVLDLRRSDEPRGYDEASAVRQAGLEYVSLPIGQPTLDDSVYEQFRSIVRDKARQPIFVHCATSNRVGALLLTYYAIDLKYPVTQALELAKRSGLRSQDLAGISLDYIRRHSAGR